ncbi:tudor domain-containing protein 1 isoform X2 [Ochlerotatus camptorhynchus]|uniref:tudor domain-containing protein 1 isoform X2 n=1 Tax=Ochlerotatus camptorhynchus TaxID=644619 RepID=UPI0031DBE154
MDTSQMGTSGVKDFLRDLILRAEDVLGKMIYKLTITDISIGEMVAMINSVFALVSQWEENLKDISMEMLNIPATGSKPVKTTSAMDERKIMEQVSLLVRKDDGCTPIEPTMANTEDAKPVFVYLEQSLKQYNPGCTGRCVISSVGPTPRFFCMVDLDHSDCKKLFAAMQNMYCDPLSELPPAGEVFGVFLEGSVYRAVRNKPIDHSPLKKIYIRLLDTGEILPYDAALPLCSLSEYYRKIPSLAIRCMLVDELDDLFGDNSDQYLKATFQTIQFYTVVSAEKAILFVKLRKPVDQESVKGRPISKSSQKKPQSNQNRDVSSSKLAPTIPEKPLCPYNGSPESSCTKGAHSKNGSPPQSSVKADNLIVPPIGSKVMLIPKFIRDVQHLWCQLVLANDVTIEADLKEMELRMNIPQNCVQFKKLTQQPEIAQQVLAKYKGTRWYRAEVVRYFDEQKVLVFYVDHGHADMVALVDIRQWDARYSYLPYQTVLCRLSNVEPMKRFHKQAVIEMNRTLLNKRFWATIVDNANPLEIIIYDQDGFDMSIGLVIAGMVKRIKDDMEPDSSGSAVGA